MRRLLCGMVAIQVMTWAFTARASSTATAPHVQVALISELKEVHPGGSVGVGVQFKMEKGWHVYWQNPGDSGQAPRIRWKLPAGLEAGPLQWPAPQRLAVGPLMNFGYEDAVMLPTEFRVSPQHAATPLHLEAQVNWLVCAELCIPGTAQLDINLPVAARDRADADVAVHFTAARGALPQTDLPTQWTARAEGSLKSFKLYFTTPTAVRAANFFPLQSLQVENAQPQIFNRQARGFDLDLPAAEQLAQLPATLSGLVLATLDSGDVANFLVHLPVQPAAAPSYLVILGLALLGGMVLNLMPCVFPVLSLKIIHFVQLSGHEQRRMRQHAWLYAAGVIAAFWLLTGALLVLRQGGAQIGWGFQLQSPTVLVALASLLFFLALNLLGIFELGGRLMGAGQGMANRGGALGAFFTGALATVVATPCTAPFMGTAIGFALSQPAFVAWLVFTTLGVGLALPYVALCYVPQAGRLMPRPGRWMETFKQVMAFPLFGTSIWLVWVFSLGQSANAVAFLLLDFLCLGVAAWVWGRWPRAVATWVGALFIVGGVSLAMWQTEARQAGLPATTDSPHKLTWEPFSPERLAAYRAAGRPVFVDFTAAWCVSCKVNEALVFGSSQVRDKFLELKVVLLKADWTTQDPVITQTLASFGRSGVPLYILYGKGKDGAIVQLPEIITAGLVLNELNKL